MAATPEQIEHVRRLFVGTIPEIAAGTVELVSVGAEPGVLAIAVVRSKDYNVCPVGARVGRRGERIKGIVAALGYKVNITLWEDEIKNLVTNVLNPVRIEWWEIDVEAKQARAYVTKPPAPAENNLRANLLSEITGYSVTVAEYF